MAKLKVQGNASGTGVVTLTAPNTNTDRTITLPDGDITLGVGIADNATSTAITIDASENVGIGTTTPSKNFVVSNAGAEGIEFDAAALANLNEILSYNRSTSTYIPIRNSASEHQFYTNSSERMRITSDGRGLSQFTAKAWVNFNGTGTVAIRDSHNVSSITDTGTGSYTINFSNNLGNTSYSAVSVNSDTEANGASLSPAVFNVGSLSVASRNGSGTLIDGSKLNATVFGD